MGAGAALRAQARVERDARKRVRLLASANVEAGMPVEQAAQVTGMSRATPEPGDPVPVDRAAA